MSAAKSHRETVENGIGTIHLDSWADFPEQIRQDIDTFPFESHTIWRGQREQEGRRLLPKLDRRSSGLDGRKRERDTQLRLFQRASLGRLGRIRRPLTNDENQWWAIGQHYGLATPLLDWTRSPFIALFFAYEAPPMRNEKDEKRAVYRLLSMTDNPTDEKPHPQSGVYRLVEPLEEDNARLINQQGLFTITDPSETIEDVVKRLSPLLEAGEPRDGVLPIMRKYIMPAHGREKCLKYLNHMNINYATLFPDIEGVARHCNLSLDIGGY